MNHRVFIAVNLPKEIKEELLVFQKNLRDLPVRWVKEDNLHITLIFLGYLKDEQTAEICKLTRGAAEKIKPFSINLNRSCYGPPGKIPPRMVWVFGEKSQELTDLKSGLEKEVLNNPDLGGLGSEKRLFSPHITLGRIRQWEWQRLEPEERPEVERDLVLNFEVRSVEVMESRLKKGGAEYTILESAPFHD